MTLFKNDTHQEIWMENWCDNCYQSFKNSGTSCPILVRALDSGRKPPQWERRPRETLMAKTIKCNEFARKPPRAVRAKLFEDVPMFDVPTDTDANYVPVEGWPERPRRASKEGDHA